MFQESVSLKFLIRFKKGIKLISIRNLQFQSFSVTGGFSRLKSSNLMKTTLCKERRGNKSTRNGNI